MNKETVMKDMQEKLEELNTAKQAVNDFVAAMEEQAEENTAEVGQLKAELMAMKESLALVADFTKAKLLKAEIDELKADIELQEQVASAKHQAQLNELSELAEEFLNVNKAVRFFFTTVDKYFLSNTSLSELEENVEYLNGVAQEINFSLKFIRQILLDTGLIASSEQNKNYKGYHLGQRDVVSELDVFKTRISQMVYEYKRAGILA